MYVELGVCRVGFNGAQLGRTSRSRKRGATTTFGLAIVSYLQETCFPSSRPYLAGPPRSTARTRVSTAAAPRAPRHLSRGNPPVNPSYHSHDHNHSNSENRNYNHYWRSATTTNLRYSAAKFSAAFPSRNLQGVPLWKRRHSRALSQALRNGHLKRSLALVPQQSFPNVTIIAEAVVSGGDGPLPQYTDLSAISELLPPQAKVENTREVAGKFRRFTKEQGVH
jgi:hypothetical protein